MNGLDSHIEALFFDYTSFGILTVVNNIWTWIAVLTAAVSFWRFKASSTSGFQSLETSCIQREEEKPVCGPPRPESKVDKPEPVPSTPRIPLNPSNFENDGVTSGKFIKCYRDDHADDDFNGVCDDEFTNEFDGDGSEITVTEEWWGCWERMLTLRRGDEWYSYQDLTAINGNVVRLWDERKFNNSRCVVWYVLN